MSILLKKNDSQAPRKYPDARFFCLRRSGFAQAGEILRPKELTDNEYLDERRNKPAACLTRGRMRVASRRIRSEFLPRRQEGEAAG
jgi:hypothetical protein